MERKDFMRPHAFTDEEVKVLRENKYAAFVSNNSIRFTLEFKEVFLEKKKEGVPAQCHLDKDDAKNSVCRNMHPVLFLYNFINHLTG